MGGLRPAIAACALLAVACGSDGDPEFGADAAADRVDSSVTPGMLPDADPTAPDADPTAPDADPSAPDASPGTPDASPQTPDAAPVAGEPAQLVGITDAHNAVRAGVGVGELVWDDDLAAIAKAWAEQCVDQTSPSGLIDHNPNRSDNYPGYVGENIYGSSGQATGPGAVSLWAAEEQFYDYPTNSCDPGKVCGHYTQVVWAATERLGCGYADCPLTFGSTVVCNYSPGGNTGGPPY
jgi:uncharacterized protein YkwD